MSDAVLLRFRDLTQGVNTIAEHNRVAAEKGKVLWGWWKKPLEVTPDPGLTMLKQAVSKGSGDAFFVDTATRALYRANLLGVHYEPGGAPISAPDKAFCPDYYKDKHLAAWFEIGILEKVGDSDEGLNSFAFSFNNRTSSAKRDYALPAGALGQNLVDFEPDFLDLNVSLWLITPIEELEVAQRSPVVSNLARGVWPAKGKYALHISDIHFGAEHAYRNELSHNRGSPIADESLREALLRDLDCLDVKKNDIALLLVTGDLTWRGDAHEFANAQELLASFAREFGLHPCQVVTIPGNHDIEWRENESKEIDDDAELNFFNFCRHFYARDPEPSFLRIHRVKVNDRVFCIIGLNSCRIESKERAGYGFVGRDQLNAAMRFLNQSGSPSDEIRIALVHHHLLPVNYVEGIDWDTKRLSLTLDAEAVIRCLMAAGVRVILHGHQHQPYVSVLRRIIEGYANPVSNASSTLDSSITIVGGGSVGVKRSHLNIIGRNAYNLIDLTSERLSLQTRVGSPVGPGYGKYQVVERLIQDNGTMPDTPMKSVPSEL